MKINYNVTGSERKALVKAISQELNIPSKYLGMPSMAFEVGSYNISKDGVLEGTYNTLLVECLKQDHDFTPVSEEYHPALIEAKNPEDEAYPNIDQHHLGEYANPNEPMSEDRYTSLISCFVTARYMPDMRVA